MDPDRAAASAAADRRSLRERLLARRDAFAATTDAALADAALAIRLRSAIDRAAPRRLGLYAAIGSEFNAARVLVDDGAPASFALALPYARRAGRALEFRSWSGAAPTCVDECGIASSDGEPVEPDVVVVPCVGYTPGRCRVGYGGGYYDRWLAAHPHATSIGVAYAVTEIDDGAFDARAHDVALTIVVTDVATFG